MNSPAKIFSCANGPPPGNPNAACIDLQRTRPLHDFASSLINFTRTCFEKATYLPFPVGSIIKAVEETVDLWTRSFVDALEGHSLRTLAAVDDQIHSMGTSVERCMLCTSTTLRSAPAILHRRGVIGLSADLWMQHEADFRENAQKAIDLANKFPLLNLITPIFSGISALLARTASEWLVKHSQVEEKGIQASCEEILAQENVYERDGKGFYLRNPSQVDDSFARKETTVRADEGIREIKELPKVDEPVDSKEEKANLPDVLELIDTRWLMGAAALSQKESARTSGTVSSLRSSGQRVRKGLFKR